MNRCCWKNPPFFCLNYRRYLTIGVTSVSALLRYRRYLSLSGYGSLLVKDPTNSFVRTIGVTQVSAILNYRRHFAEGMIWLALTLFRPASNWLILPAISLFKLSALPKYRRFQSTIKGAHFPVAVHSIPGAWPSKTSPLDLLNCCLDCCLDLFSGSSFKYLLFFF